jgi:hypothetical protein
MTDKAAAIHDLELGYQEFRGSLHNVEEDRYKETWLGEWNLSQLLAHMAGWFREMTPAFERVSRGERPTPEGADYSKSDEWNAGFAKNSKPGTAALKDFEEAYARYLAAAKALPDNFYGQDPDSGKVRIGNRLLQASGIGHFAEHQPQLDAWIKAKGE